MTVTVIGDNTGDDYSGTEDTYLKEGGGDATNNFSTSTQLFVSKFNLNNEHVALLGFSGLSNIPSGDTVSAATIGLYLFVDQGGGTHNIEVRKTLPSWVENETTWNISSTGNNWTTAGARSLGNDISNTQTATVAVNSTASEYKTWSSAQLATDVDGLVKDWRFERTDVGGDSQFKDFMSSNGTDGQRPYISVIHTAPTAGNPWYYYAQQ